MIMMTMMTMMMIRMMIRTMMMRIKLKSGRLEGQSGVDPRQKNPKSEFSARILPHLDHDDDHDDHDGGHDVDDDDDCPHNGSVVCAITGDIGDSYSV